MRKSALVILAFVLCLGLCACSTSGGVGANGAKNEGGSAIGVSEDTSKGTSDFLTQTFDYSIADQYGYGSLMLYHLF